MSENAGNSNKSSVNSSKFTGYVSSAKQSKRKLIILVVSILVVILAGGYFISQRQNQKEIAQQNFTRGAKLFKDGRYKEAKPLLIDYVNNSSGVSDQRSQAYVSLSYISKT